MGAAGEAGASRTGQGRSCNEAATNAGVGGRSRSNSRGDRAGSGPDVDEFSLATGDIAEPGDALSSVANAASLF